MANRRAFLLRRTRTYRAPEVIASALLQLKNNPRLFKKWRKQPGPIFKAMGRCLETHISESEMRSEKLYGRRYTQDVLLPKEVQCGVTRNRIRRKVRTRNRKPATNQLPKAARAAREGMTNTGRDAVGPTEAMADRATAWLGSSLHVKGEIWGMRTCTLTEQLKVWSISMSGKLTVGATAKLTADVIADEVIVYGA